MKFNEKKPVKKQLTDEERAAIVKARKDAAAADRKVAEDLALHLWEDRNPNKRSKMSFKQVRGHLNRLDQRGVTKEGRIADYNAMWASVLRIVLDNTQTKENPFAKLATYPR